MLMQVIDIQLVADVFFIFVKNGESIGQLQKK